MAVFSDSVKWVPCVSSIRDNLPMGRRPLEVGQLQPLLAERINDVASELGVSGRALAEQIGVGKDRVLAVLASNQAMTVNELDAMCRALGLTASEVVREAEEAVARAEDSAVVEPASGGAEVVDWRTEAARVRAERERGARIAASMAAAAQHIDDSVDDDNANV